MFLGPRIESGLAVVPGSVEFKDWFPCLLAVELLDKPFSLSGSQALHLENGSIVTILMRTGWCEGGACQLRVLSERAAVKAVASKCKERI